MADVTMPVKRLTDEAFIGGNAVVIDELVSPDFVDHDPIPGLPSGREGLKAICQTVVSSFADRKLSMHETLVVDDRVVENWAMTSRHVGEAMGIPPTNREVVIRGMEIFRVRDGKIVERTGVVDMSALFQP